MAISKTYRISQTLNNKVDSDRLSSEIRTSSITAALDYITTQPGADGPEVTIAFKADFVNQENVLDGLITTHNGQVVQKPEQVVNALGAAVVAISGIEGYKETYVSFNFADKTTWWHASARVIGAVMQDTGSHTIYNLPEPKILIDATHWKMSDESTKPSIISKAPVVYVDGVVRPENYFIGLTKQYPTGGYDIHYQTGAITFNIALTGAEAVTMDYSTPATADLADPYGTRASAWELHAPSGSKVVLKLAEVQFAKDVRMTDSIRFVPYYIVGKDSSMDIFLASLNINLPAGYKFPLTMLDPEVEKRFNTQDDLIDDSDNAYEIPATLEQGRTARDISQGKTVYVFNYQGSNNMILDEPKGYFIRLWLKDDTVLEGSKVTVTVYGTKL